MDEIYRHLGSCSLWSENKLTECSIFEATEIWRGDTSGRLWIEHRSIEAQDIPAWLTEPSTKHDPKGEAYLRLVRLVIVTKGPIQQGKTTSADSLSQILTHFDLRLAHDYAMSCFAGMAALPRQPKVRTYTLTYHPKLAAIWSHSSTAASTAQPPSSTPPRSNSHQHTATLTQGIFLSSPQGCIALRSLLDTPWDPRLTSHAMFPAFLCGLMMSQEVDSTQNSIKAEVRQVEVRTGHHRFASRQEQPAAGELGQLSASMSGFATKLASTARKIKVARELQEFLRAHACETVYETSESLTGSSKQTSAGNTTTGADLLEHHIQLMEKRLEMQLLDNEFIIERTKIQLNAIFNLIAQRDSLIGLRTAYTSQLTALSSLRDSSSMKALALVALVFLPGNFVAALFSAPLFDWESAAATNTYSISVGTKPQFRLFWAITLPLTALAFILYAAWLLFQRGQRCKMAEGLGRDLEYSERKRF